MTAEAPGAAAAPITPVIEVSVPRVGSGRKRTVADPAEPAVPQELVASGELAETPVVAAAADTPQPASFETPTAETPTSPDDTVAVVIAIPTPETIQPSAAAMDIDTTYQQLLTGWKAEHNLTPNATNGLSIDQLDELSNKALFAGESNLSQVLTARRLALFDAENPTTASSDRELSPWDKPTQAPAAPPAVLDSPAEPTGDNSEAAEQAGPTTDASAATEAAPPAEVPAPADDRPGGILSQSDVPGIFSNWKPLHRTVEIAPTSPATAKPIEPVQPPTPAVVERAAEPAAGETAAVTPHTAVRETYQRPLNHNEKRQLKRLERLERKGGRGMSVGDRRNLARLREQVAAPTAAEIAKPVAARPIVVAPAGSVEEPVAAAEPTIAAPVVEEPPATVVEVPVTPAQEPANQPATAGETVQPATKADSETTAPDDTEPVPLYKLSYLELKDKAAAGAPEDRAKAIGELQKRGFTDATVEALKNLVSADLSSDERDRLVDQAVADPFALANDLYKTDPHLDSLAGIYGNERRTIFAWVAGHNQTNTISGRLRALENRLGKRATGSVGKAVTPAEETAAPAEEQGGLRGVLGRLGDKIAETDWAKKTAQSPHVQRLAEQGSKLAKATLEELKDEKTQERIFRAAVLGIGRHPLLAAREFFGWTKDKIAQKQQDTHDGKTIKQRIAERVSADALIVGGGAFITMGAVNLGVDLATANQFAQGVFLTGLVGRPLKLGLESAAKRTEQGSKFVAEHQTACRRIGKTADGALRAALWGGMGARIAGGFAGAMGVPQQWGPEGGPVQQILHGPAGHETPTPTAPAEAHPTEPILRTEEPTSTATHPATTPGEGYHTPEPPTTEPSHTPTLEPSPTPTTEPSQTPTLEPSHTPTVEPTHEPPSPTPTIEQPPAGPDGPTPPTGPDNPPVPGHVELPFPPSGPVTPHPDFHQDTVHFGHHISGSAEDGSLTFDGKHWDLVGNGLKNIGILKDNIAQMHPEFRDTLSTLNINPATLASKADEAQYLWKTGQLTPDHPLWKFFHLINGTSSNVQDLLKDPDAMRLIIETGIF